MFYWCSEYEKYLIHSENNSVYINSYFDSYYFLITRSCNQYGFYSDVSNYSNCDDHI